MKDAGRVERASMESSAGQAHGQRGGRRTTPSTRSRSTAGYGLSAEYEVGRLLLEAKSLEFGEGTSELHRKLIAEFALGAPASQ